ncbi:MAG: hypothetical protein SGCHY_005643 [Lobulomycetales sp.]
MQTAETAVLLEEVLASVERLKLMSPLGMVQVLSNNRSATVGMVKDMIIQSMHAEKAALILDRKLVSSYEEETLQLGKSLAALEGPVEFQVTHCDLCERKIELPSVHFLCKHSFHLRCIREQTECLLCRDENQAIRELLAAHAEDLRDQDLFSSQLSKLGIEERFDFILESFRTMI